MTALETFPEPILTDPELQIDLRIEDVEPLTLAPVPAPEPVRLADPVELFGVQVDPYTLGQSVEAIRQFVEVGTPHQHVVLNAAKVVAMEDDPALREVISSCSMILADGISIVHASRLLGRPLPERVAGIDLFETLMGVAETDGKSVYFLGARQSVLDDLVVEVRRRHPKLRIAGTHDGYWSDDAEVVAAVQAARPDYLFLAIPSPRKEFWLHEHLDALGVPFVMGVGGSFDVVAGLIRRAPVWAQKLGMEWAWRLAQEPKRMFKRYLVGNSRFVALVARAWWRKA